ncbi:MAG: hypothetical protein RI906_2267 [Pseudomonadota bacterium]
MASLGQNAGAMSKPCPATRFCPGVRLQCALPVLRAAAVVRFNRLVIALLLTVISLLALPARAADLVESRAYWRDASGQADFETARQQTYRDFRGVFSGGYVSGAHWFRLRIAPSQAASLKLRVRPFYLDQIQVYDPAVRVADGSIRVQVTGDLFSAAPGALPALNHVIALPATAQARDIWLRLESSSTHLMHAEVFAQDDALASEFRWLAFFSLLMGLIVLTALWALTDWSGRRDPLVLVFAAKQVVIGCNFALYTGIVRLLVGDRLPAPLMSDITNWFIVLSVAMGGLFELLLLREFKPPRFLQWVGWLVWAFSLVNLALLVMGQHQRALQLNALQILLITVLVTIMAFTGRVWTEPGAAEKPVLPRRWLRTYYCVVFATVGLSTLAFLDLFDTGEWGLIGTLAYGLISGVLMIALLQMRTNLTIRSQRAREERLRLAEATAGAERARREEQSRFLAMLTHELKTPLSVVRIALGTPQAASLPLVADANRAMDDMRAVIDRCVQTEQAEEGVVTLQRTAVNVREAVLQAMVNAPSEAIEVYSNAAAGELQTDPTMLRLILANLIDNALKYRVPGSTVSIELAGDTCGVTIRVSNPPGAAGFPEPSRVFEKYYRSPGAHRETGSGLGLYLVSLLVRLLGGEIHYRPTENAVRFELWIPRSKSS